MVLWKIKFETVLHISFLHELRWRCQKGPTGGQRHLESSGCQVFCGLRLQVVWAARCLHGVPSGKDRHAAASFACEGSAACTQPLMYCECTVRDKLDQTWVEAVLSTARKAVASAELPRSSLLLWALSCALQVLAVWPYLSGSTWRVKGCGWKREHVVIGSSQGTCPCLF